MPSPFITVTALAAALGSATPPAVLDASLVLHSATFDGDYRRESGRPAWIDGHIPGSRHVDVVTQFSDPQATLHYAHPEPAAIAAELARLGVAEGRQVVVYDSTGGMFAARLWYLLDWIGVPVRVLDGGFRAWAESGRPVESGESPAPTPVAAWPANAVRPAWVTKEELIGRSEEDLRPLVCGLPAGSFTGSDPTRYSRRGHIPGSVNVSSRDLFAADGTVRGERELREAYVTQGVSGEEEVLLYCGGGISAAANALTLAELGVTAVRIYDGSLEEWSADESLPLVVG
ncbi:MAG: thiosulfate/3-mercaptopyruvate sulfurtransferase [Microbacteriaceae bacterium]|nr:thiosulfate/3-mercaptopyruvate sulfurtransferase [Microbacteriaceae bacterium]